MPAAMVHGGGGVLFMMTTKFASQEPNKKHMNHKKIFKAFIRRNHIYHKQ